MSRRTLLAAFGVVGGLLLALSLNPPPRTTGENFLQRAGPLLPQPFDPPEFVLLDPAGDTVRTSEFAGAPWALFFGYTHCPDVCPITLSQLVRVRDDLGLDADAFRIVFVTMDPDRDTPEVLRTFVDRLGGGVIALRDDEAEVWRQANLLGVQAQKGPPIREDDPDSYLVEHSARTYLLGSDGRIVGALDPMADEATTREAVEAVLEMERGG